MCVIVRFVGMWAFCQHTRTRFKEVHTEALTYIRTNEDTYTLTYTPHTTYHTYHTFHTCHTSNDDCHITTRRQPYHRITTSHHYHVSSFPLSSLPFPSLPFPSLLFSSLLFSSRLLAHVECPSSLRFQDGSNKILLPSLISFSPLFLSSLSLIL